MSHKIFLSYRRSDSQSAAGRLYDHLKRRLGEDLIFKDVYSIGVGQEFMGIIRQALDESNIFLLIIGPKFADITNSEGQKRLFLADDYVRLEIEYALLKKLHIIPVLVDGASMPSATDLPLVLQKITEFNGAHLRNDIWEEDLSTLISALTTLDPDLLRESAVHQPGQEQKGYKTQLSRNLFKTFRIPIGGFLIILTLLLFYQNGSGWLFQNGLTTEELENYFRKLRDPVVNYQTKKQVIDQIMNEIDSRPVILIEQLNGNFVDKFSLEDFLDRLTFGEFENSYIERKTEEKITIRLE